MLHRPLHLLALCGAVLLSGCATTNLAEQAAGLAQAIAILDAGCTKTVDINISASGVTPPAGNVHMTKTCGGPVGPDPQP